MSESAEEFVRATTDEGGAVPPLPSTASAGLRLIQNRDIDVVTADAADLVTVRHTLRQIVNVMATDGRPR